MKLADILILLKKVDGAKIQKLFPSKQDEEKFKKIMGMVIGLVNRLHKHVALNIEDLDHIDMASTALGELCQRLSTSTELGAKAILNQAVLWAEIGHVERSIYLAGVAKNKNVKEPYRSQINALPANACCSRYRQISKLQDVIEKPYPKMCLVE